MTNKEFALQDHLFHRCCILAGVEPTVRQASKFRRGLGSAYKCRNSAKDTTIKLSIADSIARAKQLVEEKNG